jgi:hypothetical protein
LVLGNEWVPDAQPSDLLTVLQIFAVKLLASGFERGGDDERVVEAVRMFLLIGYRIIKKKSR